MRVLCAFATAVAVLQRAESNVRSNGPHSSAVSQAGTDDDGWSHGWDTAADAWWGYGGMVGDLLTPSQTQFVAKTYKVG